MSNQDTLSNQDTANKLGITRQAVHNSLKKSIPKLYKAYKQEYDTTPYDTIQEIVIGLNITDEKDVNSFYKYLTTKQRVEVEQDIAKRGIHA